MSKILLYSSLLFLLIGCSKEATVNSDATKNIVDENLLKISNLNDIDDIINLTDEERTEFEQKNNFKSFATKSKEVYFSFDSENAMTEEELNVFVMENEAYVEIKEIDGEKNFLPLMHDNIYKYIGNEDRLFECGEKIFKIFENQLVFTSRDNINNLKVLEKIEEIPSGFNIIDLQEKNNIQRAYTGITTNCTQFKSPRSDYKTDGRDRVRFTVHINQPVITADRHLAVVIWNIENQKKFLGKWGLAREKHSVNYRLQTDINVIYGDGIVKTERFDTGNRSDYIKDRIYKEVFILWGTPNWSIPYKDICITNYMFRCSSNAVSEEVRWECNSGLIKY